MRKTTPWQRDEIIGELRSAKDSVAAYAPDDWTLNQLLDAAIRLAETIEVEYPDADESFDYVPIRISAR